MNAENLLTLAQEALGSDFTKLADKFLWRIFQLDPFAMTSLLPAVLGTVAGKRCDAEGATGLLTLINGASFDANSAISPACSAVAAA